MQSLTAPPRDSLTAAQVTALLTGAAVQVTGGLELLAPDLTVVEDISDDLLDGKVKRNNAATIHGAINLSLSRELQWGVDLVRPYLTLSDGVVSGRFYEGVFFLTTPDRAFGESPATFDVQGFDRLYLLARQVGADYMAAALDGGGNPVTYRQALLDAFTGAGLSGVLIDGAADVALPKDKTWPLVADDTANPDQTDTPATWLRVVNDLGLAANLRGVWADENGVFRLQSYQDPSVRAPEWVFDEGEFTTIQGEDRTLGKDVWKMPNRWVFRWSNAPAGTVAADLTYQVDLPDSDPMSAASRGLVWPSVIDYEAADRATFVALGDRRVAADRRVQATWTLRGMGPLPILGHADIATLVVDGVARKVQCSSWEMSLVDGLVDSTWEEIV